MSLPPLQGEARRNFRLGFLHESLWGAALGLASPFNMLQLAAHDLHRQLDDVGLLAASLFAGMNAVQLLAAFILPARWVAPKATAWMHAPALLLTLSVALGLWAPLSEETHWRLLLWGVTAHWISLGFVVPHWAALSARNIPPERLGSYFGWCFAGGGLATVLTGSLGARLAAWGGVQWGYAACFGLAFILQVISVWLLALPRPLFPAPASPPPFKVFLAARWKEFRRQPLFLYLGLLILLLQLSTASTQFFASFLKQHQAKTEDFELYNPLLAAGGMLGSLWLGRLMDRRGPRAALAYGFLPLLLALGVLAWGLARASAYGPTPEGMELASASLRLPASLAFAGAGLFNALFGSVLLPWMLKLAEPGQQPIFTGFFNTLTAPWNFLAPWLLGRLALGQGYAAAFTVSAAAAGLALLALAFLPRSERQTA